MKKGTNMRIIGRKGNCSYNSDLRKRRKYSGIVQDVVLGNDLFEMFNDVSVFTFIAFMLKCKQEDEAYV